MENSNTNNQVIQSLLESNRLDDLKSFLRRRHCLNTTNVLLMYLFHIVQTAGILTTTVAAGYDMKEIIWVGAALNALAALIHVYEKTNDSLIRQYAKDIQLIRDGTYVDEAPVDIETGANTSQTGSQSKST